MRPKRSSTALARRLVSSSLETSTCSNTAAPPIDAATARPFSALMSATTTLAPSGRKAPRVGLADPLSRAGDDRHFVLQSHALLSKRRDR